MKIGKACIIFMEIESDEYTGDEKLTAINKVMNMPTHNGITKDIILKVLRWLFTNKDKQYMLLTEDK